MKKRIFIAINLPEDIKNKLVARREEWADLPVRFTKKNSLHLTIIFIGYVADDEMFDICRKVKEIARAYQSFSLNFSRICLGPPARIATPARHADLPEMQSLQAGASHAGWQSVAGGPGKAPRLIWLEGERNEPLFHLTQILEAAIFPGGFDSGDSPGAGGGGKEFIPHITLARIRQMDWRNLPQKPVINQQFSVEVKVESIEVMESNLQRGGDKYAVLESAELGRQG
ncbi:MAG: hypothetical protein CO161_03030 [Candidatus Portnoybacteria bacterium CG_4_9_14_3_um_filter_44_9]|uniref:RNA 2',3'-cyclic phosphodiesterase n=1 Tax=Candidatus Portnoybacteria bacterium CG_4_9_14_3_um_filter_44_9 TaxID=1974806 RepID=A0A2M7YJC7_9BACT|nr:MAG: hypothetical protein CO161_03030 [Candidatus Portnoybacteria bacterium CG_4_9_14_3_um_filter_44_9]